MTDQPLIEKKLAQLETSGQHAYADVDLDVVEDVLANHLDDLLAFASAVRARLD